MKNRHLLRSLRRCPAWLGLAMLATPAFAAPTILNGAGAFALLDGSHDAFRSTTNSSGSIESDGSTFRRKGCTATNGPVTGDCFVFDPAQVPAPTTWYQRPQVYTYAAAQAFTNYGVNKARSWSIGSTIPFDQNDSTTIDYYGQARSRYIEEISYFGSVPTLVTFKLHLHGAWNDGGRFRLSVGSGVDEDPDRMARFMLGNGVIYTNFHSPFTTASGEDPLVPCPPLVPCVVNNQAVIAPHFSSSLIYLAGNDAANANGSVDQFIDFTMLLRSGINPLMVDLLAIASDAGAEMDAFSTATLDSITVQPGVSLTFGSGTRYNVLVAGDPPPPPPPNGVPEPGAPLLVLTGLAALIGTRRLRK